MSKIKSVLVYILVGMELFFVFGSPLIGNRLATGKQTGQQTTHRQVNAEKISDQANILNKAQKEELAALNDELTKRHGHPTIAVLTVTTLNGTDPNNYSEDALRSGKFGSNQNTVLLFVDVQEKLLRIQVGSGLNTKDFDSNDLVTSNIKKSLSAGDFATGTVNLAKQIKDKLAKQSTSKTTGNELPPNVALWFYLFATCMIALTLAVSLLISFDDTGSWIYKLALKKALRSTRSQFDYRAASRSSKQFNKKRFKEIAPYLGDGNYLTNLYNYNPVKLTYAYVEISELSKEEGKTFHETLANFCEMCLVSDIYGSFETETVPTFEQLNLGTKNQSLETTRSFISFWTTKNNQFKKEFENYVSGLSTNDIFNFINDGKNKLFTKKEIAGAIKDITYNPETLVSFSSRLSDHNSTNEFATLWKQNMLKSLLGKLSDHDQNETDDKEAD